MPTRPGTSPATQRLPARLCSTANSSAECEASEPAVSFNTCPAAMNNAELAFDRTYTRHYPTWFELHESLNRETGATVAALRRVLAAGPQSESELLDARKALLR